MSRIYDNWEKLVGAVLKREELRRLALCESFSSSNFSSRPSFDSTDEPLMSCSDPAASSSLSISISHNIMAIQFEEIKLATQNFQPDMLLGEGRYGPVFKGWIHEHFLTAVKPGSGIAVAVKMLNKSGMFSWSQPHDPNLVKLIGNSFEEGNRVLVFVYEFMPNGSLDNHLFTRGHQLLSWETRVQVAIGAARCLSFFHGSAIMVTHEGVNCSSILLDDEFNAHFSDFDLTIASCLTHTISTPDRKDYAAPEYIAPGRGQSLLWERRLKIAVGAARALAFLHASKRQAMYRCFNSGDILLDNEFNAKLSGYGLGIVGIVSYIGSVKLGYEAPEYAATGHLYLKSDVYSFGVVLLELLSGYPAYDRTRGRLMEWAKPHLESQMKVSRIMDPKLEGRSLPKGAYKVAQLASLCVSLELGLRPSMAEVVVALEQLSVEKYDSS